MRLEIVLLLAFCTVSFATIFLASDVGERLKMGFADLWCPDEPKLPVLDPTASPDTMAFGPPTCQERVLDAAGGMFTLGVSIFSLYTVFLLWTSVASAKNGSNNGGVYSYMF